MSISNRPETSDEISIKQIYEFILEYFKELKYRWKLLVLINLIFLPYFLYQAVSAKRMYTATVTFMVNEDESATSMGGIGGIIGGLGLGGLGNNFNIEKILSLVRSKRIITDAILKEVKINEDQNILGNHLINHLDSINQWYSLKWYQKLYIEEPAMKNYRFNYPDSIEFLRNDNKAIQYVCSYLGGNGKSFGALQTDYGEKDFIMEISYTSTEEDLSEVVINNIFSSLSEYYISKSIEKQQYTYDVIKFKADSIYSELNEVEYKLATFNDSNFDLVFNRDKTTQTRLSREIQKLTLLYAELIKNLEIADFSLKNKTPFIQVLDKPVQPLPSAKSSYVTLLIRSLIISFMIWFAYVVIKKFFNDTLT